MVDFVYEMFVEQVQKHGLENAVARWEATGTHVDRLDELQKRYDDNLRKITDGGPAIVGTGDKEPWYQGPLDSDPAWNSLVGELRRIGRGDQIPSLNASSSKVVAETPNPATAPGGARGLVVGFVQSGKTTNFTAVAAKLADLDYRAVIVLSGIHNALRRQTQERLNEQLVSLNPERWFTATTLDEDFWHNGSPAPHLTTPNKTMLIVAKKNARVLDRLLKWLKQDSASKALQEARVLVIDDEADQASVATRAINPKIRELLSLLPKSTYIGYTATPFANVFINPADSDDLYPRDFILNLPRPEKYFGPEKIFGREDADPESPNVDGYDMVRFIPEEDEAKLRPKGRKAEVGFVPTLTDEVRQAVQWFLLATSARFSRGQVNHSSMLIHTSFKTSVHESFKEPLMDLVDELRVGVERDDNATLTELRELWEFEQKKVPAEEFGREAEHFETILQFLPRVFKLVKVVVDNSNSEERLVYPKDEPAVTIAVGGNTLSRGLTLEGLVSSVFIRPGNAYDTLLQMGRWFGFRIGYEDLPRIWMTPVLHGMFRHLAMVEHEMRDDIDTYERQSLTPMDVAVRIRTHPSLRVTAKMGAAAPAKTTYSGARLQTRYFRHRDHEWLENNLHASYRLLTGARSRSHPVKVGKDTVFRDVPVDEVLKFLESYNIHPDSSDMEPRLLRKYIEGRLSAETPELTKWNIAVIGGSKKEQIDFGGVEVNLNVRSQLKLPTEELDSDHADIKTLMSKEDMVVDLPGITQTEAKAKKTEADLKARRSEDPDYKRHGLLALYPIDKNSAPSEAREKSRKALGAVNTVVGLALVFPHAQGDSEGAGAVRTTHISVELPEDSEIVDNDPEIYGTADE